MGHSSMGEKIGESKQVQFKVLCDITEAWTDQLQRDHNGRHQPEADKEGQEMIQRAVERCVKLYWCARAWGMF